MKRNLLTASTCALGLASLLGLSGCNQNPASPSETRPAESKPAVASAEPTSFKQVTAHLDPGGNFYLYLSTEQWLDNLSGRVAGLRGLADAIPDLTAEQRDNVGKGFEVVTNLIRHSGIEEISGFGMSSIAREKGFYHSRTMLHHYPGKGSGYLWNVFGQKGHALDGLELLPAKTALAVFSDLDIPLTWSIIQKEVAQSGIPQAEAMLKQLPDMFEKAAGLPWEKVLASLGGEFGFALTLDEAKPLSLPLPGASAPFEVPEPGLILIAKVKDDTIFKRLEDLLKSSGQQVIAQDKPDLKMRTVQVPLPLPIQLRPTLALAAGYLFVASSDALVQDALAVKAGKQPGLKTTDDFKHLAGDVPQEGNSFTFLSPRFGKLLVDVQRQALAMAPQSSGEATRLLQSLLTSSTPACAYNVSANTDEGWVRVGNGNQNPARVLLVGAVVPAGILAAVAIPNFVKARQAAQKNACINNLRQIDAAKKMWALDNPSAKDATPSQADLKSYLKTDSFPTCPAGGEYTINAVGQPPQCSIAGHVLKAHR